MLSTVPVKSVEQQAMLMLHRSRDLLIRQRTALVNTLRGHFGEFGIVVGQGIRNVGRLVEEVTAASLERVPMIARAVLEVLMIQLGALQRQIQALEGELLAWHRANAASQRLATIPGIGPITASAIVATVTSAAPFRSAREFSAWIGLVPRQQSSGGKERLGGISERGDAHLRRAADPSTGSSRSIRLPKARGSATREGRADRPALATDAADRRLRLGPGPARPPAQGRA